MRNSAAAAVSFFFILSGFLSGYVRLCTDMTVSVKDVLFYVVKKLKRFYPLYFILTIFTISYSGIAKDIALSEHAGLKSSLIQLARCIFLVQSWFREGWFRFAGTGWFLSSALFLYLFCLPMVWITQRILSRYGIKAVLGLFAAVIAAEVLYCYGMRHYDTEYWEYIFPPARLGEYLGGIIAGTMVRILKEKHYRLPPLLFTAMEAGALFLWVWRLYLPVPDWQYRVVFWLLPNFLAIVVFAFGQGALSRLFKNQWLRYCGDISFEAFLLHPVVIHIYLYISEVGNISTAGNIFSAIFCFAATMYLSAVFHEYRIKRK